MAWKDSLYFAKSAAYWNKARQETENGSDEYYLFLAFACEFAVRGALTRKNPVLNADLSHESILYAATGESKETPKTISINMALERLTRICPKLKDKTAGVKAIIDARNKELHADIAEMSLLKNDSKLLPQIYEFLVITSNEGLLELIEIVGRDDTLQARDMVAALNADRTKSVRNLIATFKERFQGIGPEQQKKQMEIAQSSPDILDSDIRKQLKKCPACEQPGTLHCEIVGLSNAILRESEDLIRQFRLIPRRFKCLCCALEILGLAECVAAGFDPEMNVTYKEDPVHYFSSEFSVLSETPEADDMAHYEYQDD